MGRRLVLASAIAALALTGCSGAPGHPNRRVPLSPAVISHFHGVPGAAILRECVRAGPVADIALPCIAWAGAHTLDVMTLGSGSCPTIPTSLAVQPPNMIVIRTGDAYPPRTIRTADLSPTTSVLRIPATIDSSKAVQVQVDGATVPIPPH